LENQILKNIEIEKICKWILSKKTGRKNLNFYEEIAALKYENIFGKKRIVLMKIK